MRTLLIRKAVTKAVTKIPINKKGPPCGEPKSLFRMVPAPGVEPGNY